MLGLVVATCNATKVTKSHANWRFHKIAGNRISPNKPNKLIIDKEILSITPFKIAGPIPNSSAVPGPSGVMP
jgi:hypothetical protein